MQADLRRIGDREWVRHFVTQNYEGDWTVLPLRAPASATHPVQMIYSNPGCDTYADTPLLAACPAIAAALKAFQCPLESVRLMRLGAGSIIKTHTDHDLDVEHGRARLHIPIETNPEVDFRLNGERVTLGEGECWYLRLSDPHSVANRGDRDRVHLVVDAIVSPWLHELLEHADAPASQPASTKKGDSHLFLYVAGWVPARVRRDGIVEWCDVGDAAFTDPFFEDTIRRATKSGRTADTALDVLLNETAAHPGIAPTAFIFHCSRCGSTLLSQLARAVPGTVVLSEAPAIDDVLQADWAPQKTIAALRAVVAALGQPRSAGDRHLVIKFDAWHVFDVPLIQDAFPGVPCVFLYRDPADVIASQMRMPSQYLLPGALDPAIAGLGSVDEVIAAGREDYSARVLARILTAASGLAADGRLDLVNYRELPAAGIDRVLAWTGRQSNDGDRARLLECAAFDAKAPGIPFVAADACHTPATSRAAATAEVPFAALERLRAARR